jgi:hypothetical protein
MSSAAQPAIPASVTAAPSQSPSRVLDVTCRVVRSKKTRDEARRVTALPTYTLRRGRTDNARRLACPTVFLVASMSCLLTSP